MSLTSKDLAFVKAWNDFENSDNDSYIGCVENNLSTLLLLLNGLAEKGVKVSEYLVWNEPLIFKFTYHVSSIMTIFRGTQLPVYLNEKKLKIFDEPSIYVLGRTCLENYLTLFYLYYEDVLESQRQFRLLVWQYSGIKQRSEFEINDGDAFEIRKRDIEKCEEVRIKIEAHSEFGKYNSEKRKLILSAKKPRLFESWISLIRKSGLNINLFRNLYGFKSSYTHAEFISVLQIKQGAYGLKLGNKKLHYLLLTINCLVCNIIIRNCHLFEEFKCDYLELPEERRYEIEAISLFMSEIKIINESK